MSARARGPGKPSRPLSLVLVSGGIDSAVALWWARSQGHRVRVLTFDYHERPAREVEATFALAAACGAPDVLRIPLPFLREAADAEERGNPHLDGIPEGYVPGRNLVFYAIAFHYAELLGARHVVGGHHGGDPDSFPDASVAFFRGLTRLAKRGAITYASQPFDVQLPLAELGKLEILEMGRRLGVPFEKTWSCYADGPASCGRCASCRERLDAFGLVGMRDPLAYASSTP